MTLICCPIPVVTPETALRDAHYAKSAGADLVEFRLDDFFNGDETQIAPVVALISDSPLPCIATCRWASEGGHYDGPEDARISLFERLGTAFGKDEHPPRYIDVELAAYERSANIRQKVNLAIDHPEQVRDLQTSLILSIHDFKGRPADLTRRMLAMARHAAAKVIKVAYMARSARDNLELFELLSHRDRPMIAIAMGEHGLMSRVLAPKFGGFLTFAALRSMETTAPGQPTIAELLKLYRFRNITRETAVYGVVGWPVSHSLSPHVHNAGFEAVGRNGVYLPVPIAPGFESLKATLLELIHYPALNLRGLSITRPHKEDIVRLAREEKWGIDPAAERIGAANTVTIDRDESGHATSIEVSNTDAPGLVGAIEGAETLGGKRVAILGAGGVARSAAFAAAQAGADVTVFARTVSRADAIAKAVGATAAPLSDVAGRSFQVIVNCTPVGMKGGPDAEGMIIDPALVKTANPVVVDTVYTPVETPFLRAAQMSGLRTVSGVTMFVNQAAGQFTRWTGVAAPTRLFERIVQEHAG